MLLLAMIQTSKNFAKKLFTKLKRILRELTETKLMGGSK
jgi:hypothetical protein